jgi:DNA-binding MarR family transcriptional regulator
MTAAPTPKEVDMPSLTDTHLVILSTAAQRDDGSVQPLPKSLKSTGGAIASILKSLLKKGLLAEQPATRDAAAWRETPNGERLMLVITDAGRQAVGVAPDEEPGKQLAAAKVPARSRPTRGKKQPPNAKAKRKAARPGTKQSLLIDLLSRRHGATIAEAVKATGWQPHSVRGAISGSLKKKLGLNIASEKVDRRGRVYRIMGR